ncbi:MAG: hypothetical protein U0T84_12525 [Chitinophagales bacterium]
MRIASIFGCCLLAINVSAQNTFPRLIIKLIEGASGSMIHTDSTVWQYEQHRGSAFENNDVFSSKTHYSLIAQGLKPESRNINTYDGQGRKVSSITQNANADTFVNSSKTVFSYDGAGHVVGEDNLVWDGAQWRNDSRQRYTFDSNGRMTLQSFEFWDGSGWTLDSRSTFTYTGANGLFHTAQTEGVSSGVFGKISLQTREYDAAGRVTSDLWQEWVGGVWQNSYRFRFVFVNGLRIASIYEAGINLDVADSTAYIFSGTDVVQVFNYGHNGGGWVNQRKEVFQYQNHLETLHETFSWNQTTTQWDPYHKSITIYDAKDSIVAMLDSTGSTSGWLPSSQVQFTFDTRGNRLSETYWLQSNPHERRTYTYDNLNNRLSFSQALWNSGVWTNTWQYLYQYNNYRLLTLSAYQLWVGNWQSEQNIYYTYETYTAATGIAAIEKFDAKVFPNPVSDHCTFQFTAEREGLAVIEWRNAQGAVVSALHTPVKKGVQIVTWEDNQHLPAGIYEVSLLVASQRFVSRIAKY